MAIENVGNLVCTAGFDLGEHLRIVVLSTSEGDDKAVKYPAIFQGSDALVITKIDLLPYLNFNLQRITADMKRLAPEAAVFQVSARARRRHCGGRRLAGRKVPAKGIAAEQRCGFDELGAHAAAPPPHCNGGAFVNFSAP